ncbi:hypothetical protein MKX03_003243 [Papaver bracteatum]|nr:hypothetical protein MKX03_003243 [Papaver bracteatum]
MSLKFTNLVYNLKRQLIEYPAEFSDLSLENKPSSTVSSSITLRRHPKRYPAELLLLQISRNLPILISLEKFTKVSRCLEWPNFDPDTVILLFRENVAAWMCFSDNRDLFKARVLQLKEQVWRQRIMKMCLNPNLIKKCRQMIRAFDLLSKLEVRFVKKLIKEFWRYLTPRFSHRDSQIMKIVNLVVLSKLIMAVLYCESFMEFLIDFLSQLPTRRFLMSVVTDVAVVPKCHLSALNNHAKGHLFAQLINDHSGIQLSDDNVVLVYHFLIEAFRFLVFKKVPKKLSVLSPEELQDLVCNKLKLVSSKDPWAKRVDFLLQVMVFFFEKYQSQKEAINALLLYPNEQITWGESLVPSINHSGERCLTLPKLNLQFLTLHGYLLRNFNLFCLESTYEIREDIQEAIPHLLGYLHVEGEIGEVKPASITADVTFSISMLFLLSISSSSERLNSEEAVPERLSFQFVCGCEVIEIRDQEGGHMNDFTGRIKIDGTFKGELQTVTVALDTAQYFMDVNEIAEKGAEDIYGTFNMQLRRKPKENNFKAILESIRDLINEYCIVPDWLHNILLGYGNPSASQWTNMPDLLDTLDLKDAFLDADHLRGSFPDYQNDVHMVDEGSELPQDQPRKNSVRFTFTQVGVIISGIQPGLTLVVIPGTGKTDRAVQILNVLYHYCPSQRTLKISHSNQALNDLFEKIMLKDGPARYHLRLGQGEQELATILILITSTARRCGTHMRNCWILLVASCLQTMFQELEECRALELHESMADRENYLMTKQAKIVAITCTLSAPKRKDFLQLGFKYDNLLMEERAPILEIEIFIPMLLQRQDGCAHLKRCIWVGDLHQLPPVVKNMAFLNAQGIYRDLGDLPIVRERAIFHTENAGFSYDYQLSLLICVLKGKKDPDVIYRKNLFCGSFGLNTCRCINWPVQFIEPISLCLKKNYLEKFDKCI